MGKIRLLEQFIIDRIAAGEVVQRPMNVVKELVENSIDAHATALTIEIADGGETLVRVTDNGSGMAHDDALLAFKRHATSKISSQDDLDHISSLGFRGEALSAISAVSHMTITTKMREEDVGIKIQIDGGILKDKQLIGVPEGTTIVVKDLFYNTPARRKFLKSKASETAAVSDMISRLILAYPSIAFQLISNGNTVLQSFGDHKLISAATAVYSSDITSHTQSINYENDAIKISGIIGVPQYAFKNRKMQSLFINGRYVISDVINKMVARAYDRWLVPGLFPFYILNIHLPVEDVDVNIHPNKLEIKFLDEEALEIAVKEAISFALTGASALPKINFESKDQHDDFKQETIQHVFEPLSVDNNYNMSTINREVSEVAPLTAKQTTSAFDSLESDVFVVEEKNNLQLPYDLNKQTNETIKSIVKVQPEIRLIGDFMNTYLLVEYGNELLILDQHAAHERIIFDQLMQLYRHKTPKSQILMIPETVTLTLEEKNILSENNEMLRTLGFSFKINQDLSVSFFAVPASMTDISMDLLLDDIFNSVDEKRQDLSLDVDQVIMRSCKRAIKGGEIIPFNEAKYLIEQFILSGHMPTCPHGRPVITRLTEDALKKYFRRTV